MTLRQGTLCTVSQFMNLRGLDEITRHSAKRRRELRVTDLARLLLHAARGLAHVHASGYAHRDVAPRNVFVSARLGPGGTFQRGSDGAIVGLRGVIADFGRVMPLSQVRRSARSLLPPPLPPPGAPSFKPFLSSLPLRFPSSPPPSLLPYSQDKTPGWVANNIQPLRESAPEVLSSSVFYDVSDCFSFGVLIWSAVTGKKPWPELTPQEAATRHVSGARLPDPTGALADEGLNRVMRRCWLHEVVERPHMQTVKHLLTVRLGELREAHAATRIQGLLRGQQVRRNNVCGKAPGNRRKDVSKVRRGLGAGPGVPRPGWGRGAGVGAMAAAAVGLTRPRLAVTRPPDAGTRPGLLTDLVGVASWPGSAGGPCVLDGGAELNGNR